VQLTSLVISLHLPLTLANVPIFRRPQ